MEIKRVHIAYFSPTGTTKRTLRAVAEGFGCSELSETDWGDPKSRAAIPENRAGRAADRRDAGLLRTHSIVVP